MSQMAAGTRAPCPNPRTLHQFLHDQLLPEQGLRVDEHVSTCELCRQTLDRLVGELPGPLGPTPQDEVHSRDVDEVPPRLPGYDPVKVIAIGGMGVVWRMRDRRFDRHLAVKVMKTRACLDPVQVLRFNAEAQICARLTHPNIVPVHETGELANGCPYYVMKLVEGQTLADRLQNRPGDPHVPMDLVQAFGQVCHALAFAHGTGIIHRDLKPRNIMIGEHGEVQLMDWGLAKVLSDSPSNLSPATGLLAADDTCLDSLFKGQELTRYGAILGTALYIPPEQAAGQIDRVDRRSDVFGLGAILCEILTGLPPYTGPSPQQALEQAMRGELSAALERLDACRAEPELIQLAKKCLSPDPAGRPRDAGAVEQAICQYLSNAQERLEQERVERERQRVKAVEERRRRKLWMGLAASVLSVLVLLVAGLIVFSRVRANEQAARELAQQREQETGRSRLRARAAMDEMSSALIDNWLARQQERTPLQVEFLKKGLAFYEQATREAGASPQDRAALAQAYRRVGQIRQMLGLVVEAEGALQHAVRLSQALAREFPRVATYGRDAGNALADLAVVRKARGDFPNAAALLEQAVASQRAARRLDICNDTSLKSLIDHHRLLGDVRAETNRADAAADNYHKAIELLQALIAKSGPARELREDLAAARYSRAKLLATSGKIKEAHAEYRQAVEILKRLVAELSHPPRPRKLLAGCWISWSFLLRNDGRHKQAEALLRQAIDIMQQLAAEYHSVPKHRRDLASGYNNLAIVLEDVDRWDEAEAAYLESIAIRKKLMADFADVSDHAMELGSNYCNLGHLVRDRGRPADALLWYQKAVDLLRPILERNKDRVFARNSLRNTYAGRGHTLFLINRHAEALKDWNEAIALDDGTRRLRFEARRALSQRRYARAVALASKQASVPGVGKTALYKCARVCAWASAAVKNDQVLREQFAARAVKMLRQAIAAGYKNVAHKDIRTESAFEMLRNRDDFRLLLRNMSAKSPLE